MRIALSPPMLLMIVLGSLTEQEKYSTAAWIYFLIAFHYILMTD